MKELKLNDLTMREFNKILDEFYGKFADFEPTREAKLTFDFVRKIAIDEESECDYVETELLDNNLYYDGKDYRKYIENIMGFDFEPDVEGAKILRMYYELKFIIDEFSGELDYKKGNCKW